jgi:flagellar motor switch protein FliM
MSGTEDPGGAVTPEVPPGEAGAPTGGPIESDWSEAVIAALDVAERAVHEGPVSDPRPPVVPVAGEEPQGTAAPREPKAAAVSGMERVIARGLVSFERLPMLEIVFDRLVRIMSTSLRNFTSDNVEVTLAGIESLRFGDYLDAVPPSAMLTVFNVREWDNNGLAVVDSAMIFSVVDVLLGGRRGATSSRTGTRPYTTIERTLVERLVRVVLQDLSEAFAPLAEVQFRFERLEVNPRFAAISRPSNAAVLARLRVAMETRSGEIQVLLPYATLEPLREMLLQQFMGEKFGRDTIWESHLAEELRQTEVALDVVLDEQTMELMDVLSLQVGDRVTLGVGPGAPVRLRCGDTALFEGRVGRRAGRLAVRIEKPLPPQ